MLLIDEFERLVAQLDHAFFTRLRGMLDQLCVVTVSRRELDRLFKEVQRTSPFANRLQTQTIGLLDTLAAQVLVDLDGFPPKWQTAMTTMTGRHPYFLQLLGFHLREAQAAGTRFDSALDHFYIDAFARLREGWRTLNKRERRAVKQAVDGEHPDVPSVRWRGWVDDNGRPFGEIVGKWMHEEGVEV